MHSISFVIPCFNEEAAFVYLQDAIQILKIELSVKYNLNVVLVDDGSTDSTWKLIQDFASSHNWIKGVSLSRNFGHQFALTCGLSLAEGDAVVCLDADLQDPPSVVMEMLAKWEAGADVVYAIRRSRAGETFFKRATASMFYRIARRLGAEHLRADAGDFRLMSRRSLNAFLSMPEQHRFVRGMVGWVGFNTADVYYDRAPRVAGSTKYTFRKMIRLAADAIISSSTIPLRFPYYFALVVTLSCLGYIFIQGLLYIFAGKEFVHGWSSLMVAIIVFGCLNLCCLGILGEYLGRIYEQVKMRPLYIVRETVGGIGISETLMVKDGR
jgi:polyisoprenyl-phosphate glycosyltransferase